MTIMNLFSVLFEKSFGYTICYTLLPLSNVYICFRRTGIFTHGMMFNDVVVYHALVHSCSIRMFMCILTVGKHLSPIVLILIIRIVMYSKLNLSHATTNYQKREFTTNEDISFMTLKILYIVIRSATQRIAMQCDAIQSINQSHTRKKWNWKFLVGLIIADDWMCGKLIGIISIVCMTPCLRAHVCMTHCARF